MKRWFMQPRIIQITTIMLALRPMISINHHKNFNVNAGDGKDNRPFTSSDTKTDR